MGLIILTALSLLIIVTVWYGSNAGKSKEARKEPERKIHEEIIDDGLLYDPETGLPMTAEETEANYNVEFQDVPADMEPALPETFASRFTHVTDPETVNLFEDLLHDTGLYDHLDIKSMQSVYRINNSVTLLTVTTAATELKLDGSKLTREDNEMAGVIALPVPLSPAIMYPGKENELTRELLQEGFWYYKDYIIKTTPRAEVQLCKLLVRSTERAEFCYEFAIREKYIFIRRPDGYTKGDAEDTIAYLLHLTDAIAELQVAE